MKIAMGTFGELEGSRYILVVAELVMCGDPVGVSCGPILELSEENYVLV